MPKRALVVALVAAAAAGRVAASPWPAATADSAVLVDGFEDVSAWSAHPAEGVTLTLASDAGVHGRCLRLDVRFIHGTGYAVVRRAVSLDLPKDYVFRFRVRGQIPANHLEFKLVDSTSANVWWHVRRDLEFPRDWQVLSSRRRQIGFAWGPKGGGEIRHVAFIELAVTAGEGGAGSVWLDDLTLEPVLSDSLMPRIRAAASSSSPGHEPARALDRRAATSWVSAPTDSAPWFSLDLSRAREFGGLLLEWEPGRHLSDYVVETSLDGHSWSAADTVRGGDGGRDPLPLPESEGRFVRVRALGRSRVARVALREATLEPLEWSATPEAFFTALAHHAKRGTYPRPYSGEQCAWAVVGLDGGREQGLLSEDGMFETGKRMCSIEPFLRIGGRLVTWADVRGETSLAGSLPIPTARWLRPDVELTVTAFATGDTAHSRALVRYRVRDTSGRRRSATLYLAVRPFQVNPPWQNVGARGGVARVSAIARDGQVVRVNGEHGLLSLTPIRGFGAAPFEGGEVVEGLRAGRLPASDHATDRRGFASGAIAYAIDLPAHGEARVDVLVPLRERPEEGMRVSAPVEEHQAIEAWRSRLGPAVVDVPAAGRDAISTLEAQLGWILVNRRGGAIQPGSRNYDRSWIRDGSLTSSALLRLGHPEVVRDFIEWFAPFQYENGKIPCCASARGPDPVTENDSHGEWIWLVAEYYRYTGDRALVERVWPTVVKAITHLDSLRAERRTVEWRAPDKRRYFGLVLPSISHEGYANPMHSYWDDFFAHRGYRDAAFLAAALGRPERDRFAAARDTFARDLAASIAATMRERRIDYVPGCAELGDFDATSTTVALTPTGAADLLPGTAIRTTFERYWNFFRERRDGKATWDAFTPYEVRVIGSFVRLGWRERANQALAYFLAHRRTAGWRQWAEVEYREPRAPRYLGDLPHTWVGSDYARSVLDMLAYERDRDSTLVVGAGVPLSWIEAGGVAVRGLRTPYGPLRYTMQERSGAVEVALEAGLQVPPGGIVVVPPTRRPFETATVNGAPAAITNEGGVVVRTVPARVVLRP